MAGRGAAKRGRRLGAQVPPHVRKAHRLRDKRLHGRSLVPLRRAYNKDHLQRVQNVMVQIVGLCTNLRMTKRILKFGEGPPNEMFRYINGLKTHLEQWMWQKTMVLPSMLDVCPVWLFETLSPNDFLLRDWFVQVMQICGQVRRKSTPVFPIDLLYRNAYPINEGYSHDTFLTFLKRHDCRRWPKALKDQIPYGLNDCYAMPADVTAGQPSHYACCALHPETRWKLRTPYYPVSDNICRRCHILSLC